MKVKCQLCGERPMHAILDDDPPDPCWDELHDGRVPVCLPCIPKLRRLQRQRRVEKAAPALLRACQALVDAYKKAEECSVEWQDIDDAHVLAKQALLEARV